MPITMLTWPGAKGVDTVVRLFQQTAQRRDKRDVLAEKVKVLHVTLLCLLQVIAVVGIVVSKPRPKNTTLYALVFLRQLQCIHR